MAEKGEATVKKTPVKAQAKTTPQKKASKGDSMVCQVCGLSVVVEQVGDVAIIEESALLCCGEPMKQKASKAKAATK